MCFSSKVCNNKHSSILLVMYTRRGRGALITILNLNIHYIERQNRCHQNY